MKALKIILLVLLIIVALVLITAALLPKTYSVSRSTTINKPVEAVYGVISDFSQRAMWDPWIAREPDAKITLEPAEGVIGSRYAWDGEKIGSGSMVIEKVIENQLVQSHLHFLKPFESEATIIWNLIPMDGFTKVEWVMEGANAYPIGRFMGLMMDGMMNADLVQGLQNLKNYNEGME